MPDDVNAFFDQFFGKEQKPEQVATSPEKTGSPQAQPSGDVNTEFDNLFGKPKGTPSKFGEGTNLYDYESARGAGMGPDETGHWSSRVPSGEKEGLILKAETHPTFGLTVKGEAEAGYNMYRGPDGRIYSFPSDREAPAGFTPYEQPTAVPAPAAPPVSGQQDINQSFDELFGKAKPSAATQPAEAGATSTLPGAPLKEATTFPELGTAPIESVSKFKPVETPEKAGVFESLGRGLTHGTMTSFGALFGTVPKWFGHRIGSETMIEWGRNVEQRMDEIAEGYKPPTSIEGTIWDNPALLADASWLAYNIGEMAPSVLSAWIPGLGTAKGIQIAGTAAKLSAPLISRLSLLGGAIAGGAAGGALEGANTYNQAMEEGWDESQAALAGTAMGAAVAALNALPIYKALAPKESAKLINWLVNGRLSDKASSKVLSGWKLFATGTSEAITEWAEEPTEGVILGKDWDQIVAQAKAGVNVMPPSFLLGMAMGGHGQHAMRERRGGAPRIQNPMISSGEATIEGMPAAGIAPDVSVGAAPSPLEPTSAGAERAPVVPTPEMKFFSEEGLSPEAGSLLANLREEHTARPEGLGWRSIEEMDPAIQELKDRALVETGYDQQGILWARATPEAHLTMARGEAPIEGEYGATPVWAHRFMPASKAVSMRMESDRQVERAKEFLRTQAGREMTAEEEADIRRTIEGRTAAWHDTASAAIDKAGQIHDRLGQAVAPFEGARVELAGSLARGDFFSKGQRTFDYDYHIEGLPLPPSEGKNLIKIPANIWANLKEAMGKDKKSVDIFVTHEGKLWAVKENGYLSRQEGAFGKAVQTLMPGGIKQPGKIMSWDAFEEAFYKDMGRETPAAEAAHPIHKMGEFERLPQGTHPEGFPYQERLKYPDEYPEGTPMSDPLLNGIHNSVIQMVYFNKEGQPYVEGEDFNSIARAIREGDAMAAVNGLEAMGFREQAGKVYGAFQKLAEKQAARGEVVAPYRTPEEWRTAYLAREVKSGVPAHQELYNSLINEVTFNELGQPTVKNTLDEKLFRAAQAIAEGKLAKAREILDEVGRKGGEVLKPQAVKKPKALKAAPKKAAEKKEAPKKKGALGTKAANAAEWWDGLSAQERNQVFKDEYGQKIPKDYQKDFAQLGTEEREEIGGLFEMKQEKPIKEALAPAAENKAYAEARKRAAEHYNLGRTGMPMYDELINNPEYFARAKKLVGTLTMMTPDEYLEECGKLRPRKLTAAQEASHVVPDLVQQYVERARGGEKMPLLVLDKARAEQEGRHRAIVAKRLGLKYVPVLVVTKVEATPIKESLAMEKHPGLMTREEFSNWRDADYRNSIAADRRFRAAIGGDYGDLPEAMRLYGKDFAYTSKAVVERFKNVKPDDMVTLWRAVHKDDPATGIMPGDWVAIDQGYAEQHGASGYGKVGSRLMSMTVPAKDIVWAGSDANEWFYAPHNLRRTDVTSSHQLYIEEAIAQGLEIPKAVLKEFPQLAGNKAKSVVAQMNAILDPTDPGGAGDVNATTRTATKGSGVDHDVVKMAIQMQSGVKVDAPYIANAMALDQHISDDFMATFAQAAKDSGASQDMIAKALFMMQEYNLIRRTGNYVIVPQLGQATVVVVREGVLNTPAILGERRAKLDAFYIDMAKGIAQSPTIPKFWWTAPNKAGTAVTTSSRAGFPEGVKGFTPMVFLNVPLDIGYMRRERPKELRYPLVVTGNPHIDRFVRPHKSWDNSILAIRVKPVFNGNEAAHKAVAQAMAYAMEINAHILVTTMRFKSPFVLAQHTGILPTDPNHPDFKKYWKLNKQKFVRWEVRDLKLTSEQREATGFKEIPKPMRREYTYWDITDEGKEALNKAGYFPEKQIYANVQEEEGEGKGGGWWWPRTRSLDPKIFDFLDTDQVEVEFCDLLHKGCTSCRMCQQLTYPQHMGSQILGVTDEPFCTHGCPQCFVRLGQSGVMGRKYIVLGTNAKQAGYGEADLADMFPISNNVLRQVTRRAGTGVELVEKFYFNSYQDRLDMVLSLGAQNLITPTQVLAMIGEIRESAGDIVDQLDMRPMPAGTADNVLGMPTVKKEFRESLEVVATAAPEFYSEMNEVVERQLPNKGSADDFHRTIESWAGYPSKEARAEAEVNAIKWVAAIKKAKARTVDEAMAAMGSDVPKNKVKAVRRVLENFEVTLTSQYNEKGVKMGEIPAIEGVWVNWNKKDIDALRDALYMPERPPAILKKDEVQWSGVLDWLKEKGVETVTKEDVMRFLRTNEYKVTPIVLGMPEGRYGGEKRKLTWVEARGMTAEGASPWGQYSGELYDGIDESGNSVGLIAGLTNGNWVAIPMGTAAQNMFPTMLEARAYIRTHGQTIDRGGNTKYSKWSLKGSDNYFEILFQIPPLPKIPFVSSEPQVVWKHEKRTMHNMRSSGERENTLEVEVWTVKDRIDSEGNKLPKTEHEELWPDYIYYSPARQQFVTYTSAFQNAGFRTLEEAQNAIRDPAGYKLWSMQENQLDFRGGHWSEYGENIAFHGRFSTFTQADGKRVLVVDEAQSDLHHEARQKLTSGKVTGYADVKAIRTLGRKIGYLKQQLLHFSMDKWGRSVDNLADLADVEASLVPPNIQARLTKAQKKVLAVHLDAEHDLSLDKLVPPFQRLSKEEQDKLKPSYTAFRSFSFNKRYDVEVREFIPFLIWAEQNVPGSFPSAAPILENMAATDDFAKRTQNFIRGEAYRRWAQNADLKSLNRIISLMDKANSPVAKIKDRNAYMKAAKEIDPNAFGEVKARIEEETNRLEKFQAERRVWTDIYRQIQEAEKERTDAAKGVREAPYRTTYFEYIFKWAMRYAAENGYDHIAWTQGIHHQLRYDLSKEISKLVYKTFDQQVVAYNHQGDVSFTEKNVDESRLRELIGDELTNKLMNQPVDQTEVMTAKEYIKRYGKPAPARFGDMLVVHRGVVLSGAQTRGAAMIAAQQFTDQYAQNRTLEGLDLRMGGEWAVNMYDRAIPDFMRKYTKPWGMELGTLTLDNVPHKQIYEIFFRDINGKLQFGGMYDKEEEAQNHLRSHFMQGMPEKWIKPRIGTRRYSQSTGLYPSTEQVTAAHKDTKLSEEARLAAFRVNALVKNAGYFMNDALARVGNDELAAYFGGILVKEKGEPNEVHAMAITPAMIESVLFKGQKRFALEEKKRGTLGARPSEGIGTAVPGGEAVYRAEGTAMGAGVPLRPDASPESRSVADLTGHWQGSGGIPPVEAAQVAHIVASLPKAMRKYVLDNVNFVSIRKERWSGFTPGFQRALARSKAIAVGNTIVIPEGRELDAATLRHEMIHIIWDKLPQELRDEAMEVAAGMGKQIMDFAGNPDVPTHLWFLQDWLEKHMQVVRAYKDKKFRVEMDMVTPPLELVEIARHLGLPDNPQFVAAAFHWAMAVHGDYTDQMRNLPLNLRKEAAKFWLVWSEEVVAYWAGAQAEFAEEIFGYVEPWTTPQPAGELRMALAQSPTLRPEQDYRRIENAWFGAKDWAKVKNVLKTDERQKALLEALGKEKYDGEARMVDDALQHYIELFAPNAPYASHYAQYIADPKISDYHKQVIEIARTEIPNNPALVAIATEMMDRYRVAGEMLTRLGIIHNLRENYAARYWDLEKSIPETQRKFGTKTHHARPRTFDTAIQGLAEGYVPRVAGSTTAEQLYHDEIAHVMADKEFLEQGRKLGFFSSKEYDGWARVDHPNFKSWTYAGSVRPDAIVREVENLFKEIMVTSQAGQSINTPRVRELEDLIKNSLVARHMDPARADRYLAKIRNIGQDPQAMIDLKNRELARALRDEIAQLEEQHKLIPYSVAPLARRDLVITEDGTIFRKMPLYAPEHIAKELNNVLGKSKLMDLPGIKTITYWNATFKAWLLQTSFFHHLAGFRDYLLGTRGKTFKEYNIRAAYREGLEAVRQMNPLIELAVKNGMSLMVNQEWEENLLREETNFIGRTLDKFGATKAIKDKITALRERQHDFLFKSLFAGLKAKAFMLEWRLSVKQNPNMDENERAAMIASHLNDRFGGLHLGRMHRNPTWQHIFRLFALAPDWTESNLRLMFKAFRRGEEGKIARKFWAGVLFKGTVAMMLLTLALGSLDDEDELEKWKKAWTAGNLRWMDLDITPIFTWMGGDPEQSRKYFPIFGHFKDPIKALFHPIVFLHHKGSSLYRIIHEAISGTDWRGQPFTTLPEFAGGGEGTLAGALTKQGKSKGPVEMTQLVSYLLAQVRNVQPTQVQYALQWMRGEMDAFDSVTKGLGLLTASTRPATAATKIMDEYLNAAMPQNLTEHQRKAGNIRREMRELLKENKMGEFERLANKTVMAGTMTRQQIGEILEESQEKHAVSKFRMLPLEWAINAWNEASPTEKKHWKPVLLAKIGNAQPETLVRHAKDLTPILREVGAVTSADWVANLKLPEDIIKTSPLTKVPTFDEMEMLIDMRINAVDHYLMDTQAAKLLRLSQKGLLNYPMPKATPPSASVSIPGMVSETEERRKKRWALGLI